MMKRIFNYLTLMILAVIYSSSSAYGQCTITASTLEGCVPTTITFTANYTGSETPTSFKFDFGDQTVVVQNNQNPSPEEHQYSVPGTYKPKLTVYLSNGDSCTTVLTGDIKIFDNPTADMILPTNLKQCFEGNYFCFTDNSTVGSSNSPIVKYLWDFGDGDTSTATSPCHSYGNSDTFTITLEVVDANGCIGFIQRDQAIEVLKPLNAKFSTNYNISCPYTDVTFVNETDSFGKNIIRWEWDLDDGVKFDTAWDGFKHRFTGDGSFNPRLIIENDFGCIDTFQLTGGAQNIFYYFDITFNPNQPICYTGNNIQFFQTPRPNAFYWNWNFGDPASGNQNTNDESWSPSHAFMGGPGLYDISLQIREPNCIRDTTFCAYVDLKGPQAIINLNPPPPNNCRRPAPIPISYLEKLKYNECFRRNLGITTVDHVTIDSVSPFIVSSTDVYCNSAIDTFTVDTTFCGPLMMIDTTFTLIPTGTEYELDSILVTGTFQWDPANDPIPTEPIFTNYSGVCNMISMHDTDMFTPSCSGPNLVRFVNNSKKYRLYDAIDNTPPFAGYPDRCKIPSYPWGSDSMQYFWNFGDGDQCTSTTANPDVKCQFSTEIQPWHLFEDSGCYTVSLRVIDTVTQCTSTATQTIVQEAPHAGHDDINYPGHMTWERQLRTPPWQGPQTFSYEGNKGVQLHGAPCLGLDYPQQIDLSETEPDCNREWFAMVFDSANDQTLQDSCERQVYDPITDTYTTVKDVYKEFNWVPKPILELLGMQWIYNTPGCKTIGLIIKTGDCYDTAWYHNYKYFPDLDPRFEFIDPATDSPLTVFCPPQPVDITPLNQSQTGIVEYIIRAFNTTNPLAPPITLFTDTFTKAMDTVYTICDTTQYTMDNTTNPPTKIYTNCLSFPEFGCGTIPEEMEDLLLQPDLAITDTPQVSPDTIFTVCDTTQYTLDNNTVPPTKTYTACFTCYSGIGCVESGQPKPVTLADLLSEPNADIVEKVVMLDLADTLHKNFEEPGVYTIAGSMKSYFGCSRSTSQQVFVGHINEFFRSDTVICVGETVHFKDSIFYWHRWDPINYPLGYDPKPYWDDPEGYRTWTPEPPNQFESFEWDLDGDGVAETFDTPDPSFTYNAIGSYPVTLWTTDSLGCRIANTKYIHVVGVDASIHLDSSIYYCVPKPIQFIDSSVTVDDNPNPSILLDSIAHWDWDFGDGKTHSFLENPIHTYTSNGDYTITLIVRNTTGCADTTSIDMSLIGPKPMFEVIGENDGCAPFELQVRILSDKTEGRGFQWNLGDGTNRNTSYWGPNGDPEGEIVTLRYDKPGTYYLSVTATDSIYDPVQGRYRECKAEWPDPDDPNRDSFEVIVHPPDSVDFTMSDTVVCPGDEITFMDDADPDYDEFNWDFGDGTQASGEVVTHSYDEPGRYLIRYTPTGANCPRVDSGYVTVSEVAVGFEIQDGADVTKRNLINTSSGASNYIWVIRDNTGNILDSFETTSKDPFIQEFPGEGTFEVCLTAENASGCSARTCKVVTVEIELVIPNVFTPNNDGTNDNFVIEIAGELMYELVIFNRWGEKVFESSERTYTWNGLVNNTGAECPSGGYYMLFKYQLAGQEEKEHTGTITLIR
ncbi:MAG: PKD domain-containing protein [Bacteroidia bacterium]